ncbi:MAG: histidine kinase, partial [Myxococcales bacterium]|nr:histidine kinase [Myxococcales bacterium]
EIVKTEQLAAVGELSAVIAHEVRNPLATIKNAVAGLRRSELRPEDGETLLEILDEETDRLNRLVDDLLAYAKPISPETSAVDLPQLVGHAVELAAAGNRDISHVEIELDLGQPCDPVEGDQALLRHALINIVDNALQAMPNGGTLTVSCRNATADGRPHVAVDFHDTGEGMDTLVRSRARDPFFTTRHGGTGLGLAIVDRVARAHGGRVEIESRHGQGTTVSLVIPCERLAE